MNLKNDRPRNKRRTLLIVIAVIGGLLVVAAAKMTIGGLWNPLVRHVVWADLSSNDYPGFGAEDAIEELAKNHSPQADDALVILSGCYFGEHPGEELAIAMESRGPRMLPIIAKRRRHPLTMQPCLIPLPHETRDAILNGVVKGINNGEKWEE